MATQALPESPLITRVDVARAVNCLLFPTDDRINVRLDERCAFWHEKLGLEGDESAGDAYRQLETIRRTADAARLFLANMGARYGSNLPSFDWEAYEDLDGRLDAEGLGDAPGGVKKCHLPYHQVDHPIWMVNLLREFYDRYDFSLDRCAAVSMSAGPHDLEQLVPGWNEDGVGISELISSREAVRLVIGAGFDPEADKNLLDRVALNIQGTTFSLDESAGYLGALAPRLVPRIHAKYPDWETNPQADEEIQDLLLTSDVDTATVTDFPEYARTAVLLCRELFFARPGCESCPPARALAFLTTTQRKFWELQSFHSRYALEMLQPRKEANTPLLDELVSWMETEYTSPDGEAVVDSSGRRVEEGEVLMDAFLTRAGTMAR